MEARGTRQRDLQPVQNEVVLHGVVASRMCSGRGKAEVALVLLDGDATYDDPGW